MVERSRPWSGTVTGDSGPYTDDQWTDVWKTLISPIIASSGVFIDQLNDLDLAGLPATPITIDTGRALVNGIWYENDASASIAIPTPAANPRVDRIVLRADWALQTVRFTRIAGAEAAAPVAPAIVQVDGVTWDLPLWQVRVTVGAVITIEADEREFIGQYEPEGVSETKVYFDWDFFGNNTMANGDNLGPFTVSVAGGGTVTTLAEAGFGAGAIELRMDGAGVGTVAEVFSAGAKPDQIDARLLVRTKQPNTDAALDRMIGFGTSSSLIPVNGVFFRSDGDGASTNWFAVCRAGGVETAVNTGQALDNTWHDFKIRQAGTSAVQFLIDGVIVATIVTDIPNDQTVFLNISAFDDGAGTPAANPYMHVDYASLRGKR